ncbi:MAG: hypothetical protein QNJ54_06005 [Prochloraceae cyanobacterium]|nr:hypothetical protein [Prochloraceae cyanobacterium]
MEKLSENLAIVANNPLFILAPIVLVIAAIVLKSQEEKLNKLFQRIKNLPEQESLEASKLEFSTVPEQFSSKEWGTSKRGHFIQGPYSSTLIAIIFTLLILWFFVTNIVPQIIDFSSVRSMALDKFLNIETVQAEVGTPVEVKMFSIDLKNCEKIATTSTQCNFEITNKAGGRVVTLLNDGSRMVGNTGEVLSSQLVQIGQNTPDSSSSKLVLLSRIPMNAVFTFAGLEESENSVGVLETLFESNGSIFRLQYHDVALN